MDRELAEALADALSDLPHCWAFTQGGEEILAQNYVIYVERYSSDMPLAVRDRLATFSDTCAWVCTHYPHKS